MSYEVQENGIKFSVKIHIKKLTWNTKNNILLSVLLGLPGLSTKESTCNGGVTGDLGSIPGRGRYPGEGNGNPLQYFCLEYPIDRGAWWATVHGVAKSRTWLSTLSLSVSLPIVKCIYIYIIIVWGFPGGSEVKTSASNAGDLGSIPGQEDPLEKEMVTHCSIFAWRIPWTEESGRLPSMGLQKS